MSLLAPFADSNPVPFKTKWRSPSNIAFVKYWGKKGHQIPANPSLSMTLKECTTETQTEFSPSDFLSVELTLAGVKEDRFALKIKSYLEKLQTDLPWLKNVALKIETKNTFPHGAGIASSASGLSAVALGLTDYLYFLKSMNRDEDFSKRASFLSRLASGSACRSIYGGFVSWGESELSGSSDLYATPVDIHPSLQNLQDSVLVISDVEKSVSSRAGHDRMKEHPFAESRFIQAKNNYSLMLSALKSADLETMGRVLESEALSLHAMMLTSPEAFTLFKPHTISAMELIWDFRRQTNLPLYFTLDAGPNLHLIYPSNDKIKTFIQNELSRFTVKIIDDQRGEGAFLC